LIIAFQKAYETDLISLNSNELNLILKHSFNNIKYKFETIFNGLNKDTNTETQDADTIKENLLKADIFKQFEKNIKKNKIEDSKYVDIKISQFESNQKENQAESEQAVTREIKTDNKECVLETTPIDFLNIKSKNQDTDCLTSIKETNSLSEPDLLSIETVLPSPLIESSTISIPINSLKKQFVTESIETTIQMNISPDENEPIKKKKLEEGSLIEQVLIKTPTKKDPKSNENEQILNSQSEKILAESNSQIKSPLKPVLIKTNIKLETKTIPIEKTQSEEAPLEQLLIETNIQKEIRIEESEQIGDSQSEQVLVETTNQIETPLEQLLIETNIQKEIKIEDNEQIGDSQSEQVLVETTNQIETPLEQLLIKIPPKIDAKLDEYYFSTESISFNISAEIGDIFPESNSAENLLTPTDPVDKDFKTNTIVNKALPLETINILSPVKTLNKETFSEPKREKKQHKKNKKISN
jgi:hypothetical protein